MSIYARSRLCKQCEETEYEWPLFTVSNITLSLYPRLISRPDILPDGMTTGDLAALVPGSNCKYESLTSLHTALTNVCLVDKIAHKRDWFSIHSRGWYNGQCYYKPLALRACRKYESMSGDKQLQMKFVIERSRCLYQLWVVSPRYFVRLHHC